jgi:GNAT superfamily N-acetyltransferase
MPGLQPGVRRARPHDRPALIAMLGRCTTETRYLRFLGHARSFPEPYLTNAVGGACEHLALVAEAPGVLVALASCIDVADGVADLGILVEDAYQRRGIGTCLLSRLVEHADRRGLRALTATVLGEQAWLLKALRAYGRVEASMRYGVFEVMLRQGGEESRRPSGGSVAF